MNRRRLRRGLAMLFVVDFLAALALVQQYEIRLMTIAKEQRPPSVVTYGQYAVTVVWPGNRSDDVDTYVRDPAGYTAWYASTSAGDMHLEHDDLGTAGSNYAKSPNFERVVIRAIQPGEYVVNVHMFLKRDQGPVPVTIDLWRLRGQDSRLLGRVVRLRAEGDEQTAFRFTLDRKGDLRSTNRLPISLLGSGAG